MKKSILITACVALLMSSCANQFNQVYKSQDNNLKYEFAKQYYAAGKYSRAATLLNDLITTKKGTQEAEESLYMLAMAEFNMKDYETAAEYSASITPVILKVFTQSVPSSSWARAFT